MPPSENYFQEGCFIIEMYNTADDPAVSVARARVRPGETTRWHRLQGISERYLLLEGRGVAEIGQQPPLAVQPGDTLLIPPGVCQRITNTGTTDLIFLAICTPRFVLTAYQDGHEATPHRMA